MSQLYTPGSKILRLTTFWDGQWLNHENILHWTISVLSNSRLFPHPSPKWRIKCKFNVQKHQKPIILIKITNVFFKCICHFLHCFDWCIRNDTQLFTSRVRCARKPPVGDHFVCVLFNKPLFFDCSLDSVQDLSFVYTECAWCGDSKKFSLLSLDVRWLTTKYCLVIIHTTVVSRCCDYKGTTKQWKFFENVNETIFH